MNTHAFEKKLHSLKARFGLQLFVLAAVVCTSWIVTDHANAVYILTGPEDAAIVLNEEEVREGEMSSQLVYLSSGQSGYDMALTAGQEVTVTHDGSTVTAKARSETVAELLERLGRCPVETLKRHPFAILVLMRCMFNWRQIPKMMELKQLLLTTVAEHPEWSQEEKGSLLGECDLILSFLMYNDISAMSRLHRSASAQMSHPAISIQNSGGWTFGSPSVLMMFHRQPGQLDRELAEEYGAEGLTACPMLREGQVFYADYAKPEGFCDEAWNAVYQYAFALAHGAGEGLFYYGDWIRKPGVAICSCNDGLRPVIFKIERTEEDSVIDYKPNKE